MKPARPLNPKQREALEREADAIWKFHNPQEKTGGIVAFTHRGIALPEDIQESLDIYVQTGRPLGGFLTACVENNLRMAVGMADERCLPILPAIVAYLYNYLPAGCWGFKGAAEQWALRKRQEREACEKIGAANEGRG